MPGPGGGGSAAMRVTREQAAANRERIVEVASRLFRERGFEGVGVDEIMRAAGLTHGGFYGHFRSKEELAAEALAHACAESAARLPAAGSGEAGLAAFAARYLSAEHRDDVGGGCPIAALAVDAARMDGPARAVLAEAVRGMIERVSGLVEGETEAARRARAEGVVAELVGRVVLGRVVGEGMAGEGKATKGDLVV